MKNITLAVDEDVLAAVKKYAAAHNKTVNGLVREYLTKLATQEDRAMNARKKLAELARERPVDLGEDWKWDREAIYESRMFPRHEHPSVLSVQEPQTPFKED